MIIYSQNKSNEFRTVQKQSTNRNQEDQKMLTEERHSIITDTVNTRKSVTIAELCRILDVSASTVKRDLNILAEAGKITKVRGGAISLDESFSAVEKNVEEKSAICTEEKTAIAAYAASLVENGDFIFLDAGTTTEKMIEFLPQKDITFVTNGFIHAKKLAQRGFRVFITGGEIKAATEAIIGAECVLTLKNYNFTKCFMGTNGISLTAGFTTPDVNEACVKSAAMESSRRSYILADHSKFDEISSATFAQLGKANIITDRLSNRKYAEYTSIKEVM
jgi:DeoR family fructose operon transcriptional repressor